MANTFQTIAVLAAVLCFSSFFGPAYAENKFLVQGSVYCDTCRVQFVTRLTEYLPDAMVGLECRNRTTETLTFNTTTKTDKNGYYSIVVEGDHEEEICEVVALASSREDCTDTMDTFERARVILTDNVGITQEIRYANPIGFLKSEALTECGKVLEELGFEPLI